MSAQHVTAPCTCLSCGGSLQTVTVGTVNKNHLGDGQETSIILECVECHYQHQLRAELILVARGRLSLIHI